MNFEFISVLKKFPATNLFILHFFKVRLNRPFRTDFDASETQREEVDGFFSRFQFGIRILTNFITHLYTHLPQRGVCLEVSCCCDWYTQRISTEFTTSTCIYV